jgi:hypothetical protein
MPAPLVGLAVGAAARAVAKKVAGNAAKKAATKAAKSAKSSRQAYDYPVSGKSAKSVVPKMGEKSVDISKNVSIKNAKSPSGKVSIGGGANQVARENLRAVAPISKAEAKANARGLKAANKPTKASKVKKKVTSTKKMENVPKDVSSRFSSTVKRLTAEETKKKSK